MIGQTVSHYTVLKKLGGGGMGVVYEAEDTRLRRRVALKFLPIELTQDENAKKRFIREARAASALDHPNICTIHDIGQTSDGRMFICMALCEGETLKKKIARGPVSLGDVIDYGIKIARGLAKAHAHRMVHRDIKPANVMVANDGEVKIVDFGLARLAGSSRVTKTGSTVGTIAYMSPEQAKSEKVDARSDIFSLGVVLYELVTGRLPFDGDNEAAVVYGIMCKDPEPLAKFRSGNTAELQQVIDKTLKKDANERYQNAEDLENDLQRIKDGMTPALVMSRRRTYRSRKSPLAAGTVATAIVVLLLIPQTRKVVTGVFERSRTGRQIVVIPFENVGGDPSNEAFCGGLMETLTSQLTQLEQSLGSLWVVPASEVRTRQLTSPSEAARVFGVNLVVGGGVQRFNGRFRVTLNLIDVSKPDKPRQLNSSVIDDVMSNVAVLQDEIVVKMAGMLDVNLVTETRTILASGSTDISEAYELYLNGRGYLQRYEKQENIDRAIDSFQRAVFHDPRYALAFAGLGEAYWRKYRATMDTKWVAQAIENGERAVELDDQLTPVRVTLGIIYAGTGEYEKAIASLREAIERDPGSAAAYSELAIAYAGAGMPGEAETAYKKAIEMRPRYWGGHYDLGVFYWRHDRPEEAVAQFRRVIELTPDNMWGYNSLGAAYYQLDRLDEAREMFNRSIDATPNYRAYSNLGSLDYMDGRYADAAGMYEKALELNDKSYITWANLANACYWLPDRREEAYAIYRRAAEMAEAQRQINPRDPRLLTSLAGYCAVIGEEERAITLTEQALELAPDNSRIAYYAGFTYEQLGDRDKALEWIGKAMELGYPLAEVVRDPWLVELRSDARFLDFLQAARDARQAEAKSD